MWILLSIITAFLYAVEGAWTKKIAKKINPYTITWSMFTFAIPLLIIPVLLTEIPQIKPPFYLGTIATLIINMIAFTMFVKALKISPLNMTYPFLSFSPVFLIFTGYFILGEVPSAFGILGIVLIAIGAYVLNIDRINEGILAPIKAIKEEKGAVLMLIVSFLWSFAAAFDKMAVLASSPYFFLLTFNTSFFILYFPFLAKLNPNFSNEIKANFSDLGFLGLIGGLMVIFQMVAIKVALVSYVIGIKRSGMIFTVIFGYLFFKEKVSLSKIMGMLFMLIGIFFIVLFN